MSASRVHATPNITVVGEAGDGAEAATMARTLHPDVVLMDIRMSRADGLTATERLARSPRPPSVVVPTTFDLDEYVRTAPAHGAAMLSRKVTRRLLQHSPRPHRRRSRPSSASRSSPRKNAKCSSHWETACPTPTSPPACT